MFKKIFTKKPKNKLSARKQIENKANRKKESYFIKYSKESIAEVTGISKKYTSEPNFKKINKYTQKIKKNTKYNQNNEFIIHTHINHSTAAYIPSPTDIYNTFIRIIGGHTVNKPQVIFLMENKKEIGRTHYKFNTKKITPKTEQIISKLYFKYKSNPKYYSKHSNKQLIKLYEMLGLNIHFFPNKELGYRFDYNNYVFKRE